MESPRSRFIWVWRRVLACCLPTPIRKELRWPGHRTGKSEPTVVTALPYRLAPDIAVEASGLMVVDTAPRLEADVPALAALGDFDRDSNTPHYAASLRHRAPSESLKLRVDPS